MEHKLQKTMHPCLCHPLILPSADGSVLLLVVCCRYDGQVFVKPPEVLTRDRLLGTYEVKPVLAKLRRTLLGAGGMLVVVSVLLFGLIKAGTDEDGVYGRLRIWA